MTGNFAKENRRARTGFPRLAAPDALPQHPLYLVPDPERDRGPLRSLEALLERRLPTRERVGEVHQEGNTRRRTLDLLGRGRGYSSLFALPGHGNLGRHWHFFCAIGWVLTGLICGVLLFATGEWVRLIPSSLEVFPRAWEAFVTYLSFELPSVPPGEVYNLPQKLAYAGVVFVLAPLMIATGAAMSPAVGARFPWYEALRRASGGPEPALPRPPSLYPVHRRSRRHGRPRLRPREGADNLRLGERGGARYRNRPRRTRRLRSLTLGGVVNPARRLRDLIRSWVSLRPSNGLS
jgi:hypothetical protein